MKIIKRIICLIIFILLATQNSYAKTEFIKIELDYFTYIVHTDTDNYDITVSDGEYRTVSGNYIVTFQNVDYVEYTLYLPNSNREEVAKIKAHNDGEAIFILFGSQSATGKWSQTANSRKFEIKNLINLYDDNTGIFVPPFLGVKPIDITWNKIDTNTYKLSKNGGSMAQLSLFNSGNAQFSDTKKIIMGKWYQQSTSEEINQKSSTISEIHTSEKIKYLCPEGYVLTADNKCIQPKESPEFKTIPGFDILLIVLVIIILFITHCYERIYNVKTK